MQLTCKWSPVILLPRIPILSKPNVQLVFVLIHSLKLALTVLDLAHKLPSVWFLLTPPQSSRPTVRSPSELCVSMPSVNRPPVAA